MNLQNRQKLLALVAGGALAVLLGERLIFSPLAKGWTARSKRIAELRQRVIQSTSLLDREQAIRERWVRMQTNVLPREVSLAENLVLKAFDQWSQQSGVSISIRLQWQQPADDYRTVEFRADAFGNISSLTRFLYLIEKDPLALKVDVLELSARDNQAEQLNLTLQVSGLVLGPSGT